MGWIVPVACCYGLIMLLNVGKTVYCSIEGTLEFSAQVDEGFHSICKNFACDC